MADDGSLGYAECGDAGPGGDVWLRGPAAGNTQVAIQGGRVTGGPGGVGGLVAQAVGGNDTALVKPDPGGDAFAQGGAGGDGGTVRFDGTVVIVQGTVEAAHGGNGGNADATGGTAGWFFAASPGGNAIAQGGHGGLAGEIPKVPLASGAIVYGTLAAPTTSASDSGGSATVKAGSGGNGHSGFPTGAPSGGGTAQGGANGAGTTPTPWPVPVAPGAPPAGGAPGLGGLGGGPVTASGQP